MESWNSRINGLVYTRNKELGRRKLLEIEKENNDKEIKTIYKELDDIKNVIVFSNGDMWRYINPDFGGWCLWNKAHVDSCSVTFYELMHKILPYAACDGLGLDSIIFFNLMGDGYERN